MHLSNKCSKPKNSFSFIDCFLLLIQMMTEMLSSAASFACVWLTLLLTRSGDLFRDVCPGISRCSDRAVRVPKPPSRWDSYDVTRTGEKEQRS